LITQNINLLLTLARQQEDAFQSTKRILAIGENRTGEETVTSKFSAARTPLPAFFVLNL
jgi:hypothetical protein